MEIGMRGGPLGAPDMNMMGTQIIGKFTLGATNEGRSSAILPDDGYARKFLNTGHP
ncbi:MAG: hypothetical protein MK104_09175 [Erythrobacter sp.]|jgi:hypothetical protein|nr:hypothetical protein [Erythrobacter sp.]